MAKKQENFVKLRVVEALQDDAYKGVVRIDQDLMRKLELERGDIISIKGDRETYSIVDQAYPADRGEEIIRMDGIMRKNCKTGIGEHVQIRKGEIREAKKVTIAPAEHNLQQVQNTFTDSLTDKPQSTIRDRIDSAKVSADQWLLHEQKNVIQKIGGLFVSIDLITDELRRKNKFFTNRHFFNGFNYR